MSSHFLILLMMLFFISCNQQLERKREIQVIEENPKTSVKEEKTEAVSEGKIKTRVFSNKAIDFLSTITSITQMNIQRCLYLKSSDKTMGEVKEFCARVREEESRMEKQVQEIIKESGVKLPTIIDFQYNEEIKIVQETSSEKLSDFILARWLSDVERELIEFQMAVELPDSKIRHFAMKYLPEIERRRNDLLLLTKKKTKGA